MLQDWAGYLLACTDHGVFAYDGRRFINLGADQGLRQGGLVYGLALTPQGRVAVRYASEVFISDHPSDIAHPPSSLFFHKVLHPGISFSSEKAHRLAAWQDGLVLLAGDTVVKIVVPENGSPHVETMPYDFAEQAVIKDALSVFSIQGRLWESFDDGRLCEADPGAVKCYGPADDLSAGPWMDVVAGSRGTILARSATSVATFDPQAGKWKISALPDQGDRYLNYVPHLGLFRTPDGGLVTQADHGLAVLGNDGWHSLTVEDGAPSGTILSALTDATGQFWLQAFGRGPLRWIGYRHWETIEKPDGLSDGLPWMSVRLSGGSMWVATDTGIDEIVGREPHFRVRKVLPGPSFVLAVGPQGKLWSSFGLKGVKIIDPEDGSFTTIDIPPVDAIVPDKGDIVWIGTEAGLFRVEDRVGVPLHATFQGSPRTPVYDIVYDGWGGVFYLSGNRLRHRHPDGNDTLVAGPWPGESFEPLRLALGHDGALWIGGAGGLFRFALSNGRISSYDLISTSDTQSNTIVAIMVDHRGWVWAGTTLGASVFNGERWISVDADRGLLSNDVDQGGIREDPDGSVWIATSHGLSHLLDPEWLFTDRPIQAVVSSALLGSVAVTGGRMPYTDAALSIQFGTPNYGAERAVLFRYRLSGVDAGWAESASGVVRYPFVPPGQHLLTLVGYDKLTHRTSLPVTLVVDIGYPWWRQWWSETLWSLGVAGLIYGFMRVRFRTILARQAELRRRIAEATDLLRHQAAHDSLTGLLNRSEIERRLATRLSGEPIGDEMIVALMDIDHFKKVNDNHGHLGGDEVLRAVGRLVSRAVRDSELAGRYGGEEILLMLDDTDGCGAERVLDLHRAIRHDTFRVAETAIHVTCSIGLSWAVAGDDWESLVGRADDALYEAKEGGRDRVVESRQSRAIKTRSPRNARD